MSRNKKIFCNNLFMCEHNDFGRWMDRNLNRVIACAAVMAVAVPFAMKPNEVGVKRAWVSDERVLQAIRDRNAYIAEMIQGGQQEIDDAVKSAPSSNMSNYDMKIIELPRGYQKKQNLMVLVSQINESVEQIIAVQSFKHASSTFADTESQDSEQKVIAISKK